MNERQARFELVTLWLEKSDDAMESAALELSAGHTTFAVNRLYYACFYAVTALLLSEGKEFARHSAVLAEFNHSYVKSGKVEARWGKFYQRLFDQRQQGDYLATATFEKDDVSARLDEAREFVRAIREVIKRG